ncbi:MAG: hypothetical protein LBG90_07970 [Spirochaetaceae bacterium]|jgi:hypothetical protein|nr:hypothetical protein [Spirochaetaceae bacterium]
MVSVKGIYDGNRVTISETAPVSRSCEVIVTFLDSPRPDDDGSLAYLFRGYEDDHIREPIIDFGEPIGNEKW